MPQTSAAVLQASQPPSPSPESNDPLSSSTRNNTGMPLPRICTSVFALDNHDNASVRETARAQIDAYGSTRFLFQSVISIERRNDVFHLKTTEGSWMARAIIFASGITDVMLSIPGVQELWNQGMIHHCIYCHGYECRNGVLGALGASPATVHNLVGSTVQNKSITLLTNAAPPDDKLRERMVRLKVRIIEDPINSMNKDEDIIRVDFENGKAERVDALLHTPDSRISNESLLTLLGAMVHKIMLGQVAIKTSDMFGRTAVPGVYVSGDLAGLTRAIPYAMFTGGVAVAELHADLVEKDLEDKVEKH
ncbi:hypothetical protein MMC30_001046 [Trapelia coarctata]|nr:hypothetical protein [Trapelia coarctata]